MLIRALTTSALRAVLLHLLMLLVCGGLLWQQLPRLLPLVGNWLLADTGVELVTLTFEPQTYPPYFIDEIKLQTATHSLQARYVSLQQLAPWQFQWRIAVGLLQVSANHPISAAEDRATPSAGQAWQLLTAGLGQLTQQGSIDHVEYCADGCLAGAVSWQRDTDQLTIDATETDSGAQLAVRSVKGKVTVSMVIDRALDTTVTATIAAQNASARQPRLLRTLRQHLPAQLSVEAQLQRSANGDLDIEGSLVLGAKRQLFSLAEMSQAPIQLDLDMAMGRISFAAAVPSDSPMALSALQRTANYHVSAEVNANWRIAQSETAVTSSSPLALSLTSKGDHIDLTLNTPMSARIIYPDLNNAEINLTPDIRCRVSQSDRSLRDGSPDRSFTCQIPRASLRGGYGGTWLIDAVITDSRVERAAGNWSGAGNARVLVNDEQQRVLSMDSQIMVSSTHARLSSNNARAYQLPLQSVSLNHDLQRDTGELQISLDTTLSEVLKLPPLQTLPRLQEVRGKLTSSTRVFWPQLPQSLDQLKVESRYELHNVDFTYNDYQLSGINLQLALDGWPHMVSPTDARLQISQVDVGLPLTDIDAHFAIDMDMDSGSTMLTGQTLSFDLLGGNASSSQWRFDPVTETGLVQLALHDLSLQQILALERDDFDSSGRLTGSVPVHIQDGIINIQQGQLNAIAPGGYIRYRPDEVTREMLLQTGQTKIVLETLSDFQYDSLAVLLSYSPAGNLIANTTLLGRNPAYAAGREIRFNLSVEQNIGTLLRSLRLSDDVEKKIQDRSQKRQNPMQAIEVKPQ
ncbi:MAG: hypothetical protein ACJAWK_000205 [Candidatus Azotimanducaceae bacterium]|jgi:hypothetical protein